MKCPYCEKEMKLGYIDVYDTLSWSPAGESRRGGTKYAVAKNGIILAKYPLLLPASKEAYYCRACEKIIIDVAK
jgi:hypothetical protein